MIIKRLLSFFEPFDKPGISDSLTYFEYRFKSKVNVSRLKEFTKGVYVDFNKELIDFGYDWTLEIEELEYSLTQKEFKEIDYDNAEELDELNVIFKVFKNGNKVVVFSQIEFETNLKNQSLYELLSYFKTKNDGVQFITVNSFTGATSFLGYNTEPKEITNDSITLSSQCHFNNFSEFRFSPESFYIENNNSSDELLKTIKKLHFVYCLIYLFDNSEISENSLNLRIRGFKAFKYDLDFTLLDISSLDIFHKIITWGYSEKNKIEDKIGIARNILSMYLNEKDLVVDENTFHSILSANETYIKGNIGKYIEIRGKIHTQLEQISERVNKSIEAFFSNFQKSIFVFISFYLSVFIFKTYLKPDLSNVFSKEVTYMAIGLLLLSFIFMVFSNWILNLEENRIKDKYEDIKKRALDVLVKDDVEKLLDEDREFNSEIDFLNKRRKIYLILWGVTLLIFLIVLSLTSSFL